MVIFLCIIVSFRCQKEEDYPLPPLEKVVFYEDFNSVDLNQPFDSQDWCQINEFDNPFFWQGKYNQANYSDRYLECNAYYSDQIREAVLLISPKVDLKNLKTVYLSIEVAHHHLKLNTPENNLDFFISSADQEPNFCHLIEWEKINHDINYGLVAPYKFTKIVFPLPNCDRVVRLAFRYRGSGTRSHLNGAFMIDNIKLYSYENN